MPLNNTTADAVATAICSALGVSDNASKAKYKQVYEILYAALKTDITTTILPGTIVTAGGPASQTGPAAPVPINPD
jgi:hypothetical protein